MEKKAGGGLGLVLVVITMAIVLLLVAQSWKKMAPAVLDLDRAGETQMESHGEDAAAAGLRSGDLPKISDMERTTDAHAADVQEALNGID